MNGRRGAIVLQKPPTFLENLLSGLGVGVSRGLNRYFKERDRKRSVTSQVLDRVLSGDVSEDLLATDLGQAFQSKLGIDKEPSMEKMTQMGLEKYSYPERTEYLPGGTAVTMPGVTPPEIPFEVYRGRLEGVKERKAQTEQERKLDFYMAQKRIDKIVDRDFRKSLGERWEGAWREYERAMKLGVPVKGLVVRDPDTGTTMTLDTHMERLGKQKADEIVKTKAGITYEKEEIKYCSLLLDAEKFVSKLSTAETMDPDEFESDFMKAEIGLWQRQELTPQQIRIQARRRLPIINQRIEAQYKILHKQKRLARNPNIVLPFLKQFKLDEILNPERYAGEFEAIKAYTDLIRKSDKEALREVAIKEEKLRESLSESDLRSVIVAPAPSKLPGEVGIEERIEDIAKQIMSERWTDPKTYQPYTLEQAREFARLYLEKK